MSGKGVREKTLKTSQSFQGFSPETRFEPPVRNPVLRYKIPIFFLLNLEYSGFHAIFIFLGFVKNER